MDGWAPHATQTDTTNGARAGMPKYVHGPSITPTTYDGGYYSRACMVTGHCDHDRHEHCWQADGVTPPGHDLDACTSTHQLRCRCACHGRTAESEGLLFL